MRRTSTRLSRAAGLAQAALLGGCASVIGGTTQTIQVTTNPPAANCQITRQGSPIGNVATPGAIVVQRTKHDITIACSKDGYETATSLLKSGIEDSTWGNIILGGGIGWAIDSASGADNKYPASVTLTLVPATAAQPAVPERLQALQRLRDQGLITEAEFRARRIQVLNGL